MQKFIRSNRMLLAGVALLAIGLYTGGGVTFLGGFMIFLWAVD